MPKSRKLLWQIYFYFLVIIVISLVAVAAVAFATVRQSYIAETSKELEYKARMFETLIRGRLSQEYMNETDALCKDMGEKTATRFTIILLSGRVIGDSEEDPKNMENHADRPEIMEALTKGFGKSIRYSTTLKKDMMYIAIPVKIDNELIGVVRTSMPIKDISQALLHTYKEIALGGFIIAVLAAVVSLLLSKRIDKPLLELKRGAEHFAKGELSHRLHVPDIEEIKLLAESMNSMAAQLDERVRAVIEQRNELEAVLFSMVESVIVVDSDERITKLNASAARLLGVDSDAATGRLIHEVARNAELHNFVKDVLLREESVEDEITFSRGKETLIHQAHGTIIRDNEGRRIGALVVLNDVTRLKKLENMREEFVANVSHELKTPVTSIKGFVETLRDGAIDDGENVMKFLDIISKHSGRLNAIIEDLLTLSRIEQEAKQRKIVLETGKIKDVIDAAVVICERQARDKNIRIEVNCDEHLAARIDPQLLEQAIVNLTDNAIRYSEPKTKVKVEAFKSEDYIIINVIDEGVGIPREHIPRIFERFYRVDKARSRKLGGTGLGLAIVKHIVSAHNGHITVESEVGKGSTFTIRLPLSGSA